MPRIILFVVLYTIFLPFSAKAISPAPPSGSLSSTKIINFDQNQPLLIPENGDPLVITFNVQGVAGQVWDIDLKTFIKHFTPNDLTLILTSPSGKEVILTSQEGKSLQQTNIIADLTVLHTNTVPPDAKPPFPFGDFDLEFFDEVFNGTLWDDQATLPVTEVKYSNMVQSQQESLQPEGALDAFRGLNPNGSWKLTLIDKTPNSQIEVKGTEAWEWTNDTEGFPVAIIPGPPFPGQAEFICDQKENQFPWGTLAVCNYEFLFYDPNIDGTGYEFFFRLEAESTFFVNTSNQQLTSAELTVTSVTENSPFKVNSFTNSSNTAIQDASITSSTITITNLGTKIKEIELFTELTHNFCSDLKITLTSPSQITTAISLDNGGNLQNIFANTFWDDQAATPVTDAIAQNNVSKRTLIPEGALALFRSANPNGDWTLKVIDKAGNNSSGVLAKWGLRLVSYLDPVQPPTDPGIPSAPPEISLNTFAITNSSFLSINNFQPQEVLFAVQGLPGSVWSLDLKTFINHTSTADLTLALSDPSGDTVTLSTTNGYLHGPFEETFFLDQNINQPNQSPPFPFQNFLPPSLDNIFNGTLWSDQVSIPVQDTNYLENLPRYQFLPEGSLDLFKGKNPNGIWKLTISDNRDHQSIKGRHLWLDGAGPFQDSVATTVGAITNSILRITTAAGHAEVKERIFHNTTPTPLADNNTTTSEINVNEIGTMIEQVKVFTKIAHPKSGELNIKIQAPSGKIAILSTRNGGDKANLFKGTLWNDRAPSHLRVAGFNFVDGQAEPLLIPEGSLAAFRGENPNGVWTLIIEDNQANASGLLEEWSLEIRSYLSALPPIGGFPTNTLPIPPSPFTKGDAFIFGQKGKTAYLLKQNNGKALGAPITLGSLPPKNKIVAANSFTLPNQTNVVVCLILQNKTQLSAKVVGANASTLSDALSLPLPELSDRKDKIVGSGDLNQDGFTDLVTQGRKKAVKVFLGPEFSPFPFTNDVRRFGKVVGVANGKILTRKKDLLYAITPATDTNNFTSTTVLIGSGIKPSLKIRGAADILKTPGQEVITQEGNRIGYGPVNLNGSFGFLHTNRADLTLGKAVGPK